MAHDRSGRRVLVTGGTGFIGSFLVEALLAQGAKVRVPLRARNYRSLSSRRAEIEWMEGDLRDPGYCTALTADVDEVFHLAGSRRNGEYHHKRCSDVTNDNVRMTLALIDGLKESGAVPVTFFSSANVPPATDTIALSHAKEVDGYVLGKALAETLWFTAAHQHGFPLLVVRPIGVYGPRDTFTEDGNVIPALMVKTRDSDQELKVWGTGEQERAFLYVEDLIHVVLTLLEQGVGDVQYISSSDVVTVRDLAMRIRDLVRPQLQLSFDANKPVGNRTVPVLPLHPIVREWRWTPLEEGLRRTYEAWGGI